MGGRKVSSLQRQGCMCRGEEWALNLLLYSRKHRFSHHNSDRCPSSVTLRTAESAKSPLPIRQNSIHHHALFSVYSKGLWLNALFTTCLPRAGGWGNSRLWWLTKPNDVKAPAMGLSRSTSQETPVKCLLAPSGSYGSSVTCTTFTPKVLHRKKEPGQHSSKGE